MRCGWCRERSGELQFVAEVADYYHRGQCMDQALALYTESPYLPGAYPPPWRKVTETEPTDDDMPCVVALGHGTYDIATSRKDSDWWLKDAYYDGDEAPTHWMSLPDLPKN